MLIKYYYLANNFIKRKEGLYKTIKRYLLSRQNANALSITEQNLKIFIQKITYKYNEFHVMKNIKLVSSINDIRAIKLIYYFLLFSEHHWPLLFNFYLSRETFPDRVKYLQTESNCPYLYTFVNKPNVNIIEYDKNSVSYIYTNDIVLHLLRNGTNTIESHPWRGPIKYGATYIKDAILKKPLIDKSKFEEIVVDKKSNFSDNYILLPHYVNEWEMYGVIFDNHVSYEKLLVFHNQIDEDYFIKWIKINSYIINTYIRKNVKINDECALNQEHCIEANVKISKNKLQRQNNATSIKLNLPINNLLCELLNNKILYLNTKSKMKFIKIMYVLSNCTNNYIMKKIIAY